MEAAAISDVELNPTSTEDDQQPVVVAGEEVLHQMYAESINKCYLILDLLQNQALARVDVSCSGALSLASQTQPGAPADAIEAADAEGIANHSHVDTSVDVIVPVTVEDAGLPQLHLEPQQCSTTDANLAAIQSGAQPVGLSLSELVTHPCEPPSNSLHQEKASAAGELAANEVGDNDAKSVTPHVPASEAACQHVDDMPVQMEQEGSLTLLGGKSLSLKHFTMSDNHVSDPSDDVGANIEQTANGLGRPGPSGRPQIQPLTIPAPLGGADGLMPNLWSLTSPVSLPLTPSFTPGFDTLLTPAAAGLPSPSAQLLAIFQQIQQQVQSQKPTTSAPMDWDPSTSGATVPSSEKTELNPSDAGEGDDKAAGPTIKNISAFDLQGPKNIIDIPAEDYDEAELFPPGDQQTNQPSQQSPRRPSSSPQHRRPSASTGLEQTGAEVMALQIHSTTDIDSDYTRAGRNQQRVPGQDAGVDSETSASLANPLHPAASMPLQAQAGLRGLYYNKERNRWQLLVYENNVPQTVGDFLTKEEAIYAAELLGAHVPSLAPPSQQAAMQDYMMQVQVAAAQQHQMAMAQFASLASIGSPLGQHNALQAALLAGLSPSSHDKPGFEGVRYIRDKNKWQAFCAEPETGAQQSLGFFMTAEDAARAHDLEAIKQQGMLASTNFPKTHYAHLLAQQTISGQIPTAPSRKASSETASRQQQRVAGGPTAAAAAAAAANRRPDDAKNHPKFKGVSWCDKNQKWRAQVWDSVKMQYLGYYDTPEDAAKAYDQAIIKSGRKDAGKLNFPPSTYKLQGSDAPSGRSRADGQTKVTSQYKGVSWNSACSKWVAVLWDRELKRARHIGSYESEEEAARAYDREAIKMLGPEAGLNFRESAAEYLADVGGTFANQEGTSHLNKGSSQYRGVSWHERSQRWEVRVWGGGKQHFIGSFTSELEAARAYDKAVLRLRGQDARSRSRMNFPVSDYDLEELQAEAAKEGELAAAKTGSDRAPKSRASRMASEGGGGKRGRAHPDAPGTPSADDDNEGETKRGRMGGDRGGVGKTKGVRLSKTKRHWAVHMFDPSKQVPHYIGSFETFEEAVAMYDQELFKLRGPNARTNHPLQHYPHIVQQFKNVQQGGDWEDVKITERNQVAIDAEDGTGCVSYDDLHGKWVVVMRVPEAITGWSVVGMFDIPDGAQDALDQINTQQQMMAAAQAAYSGQMPIPEHPLKRGLQPTAVAGVYFNDAENQFEAYVDYYGLPQRVGAHSSLEDAAACIQRYSNPRGSSGSGDADNGLGNPYDDSLDPNEDPDDQMQLQLRSSSQFRGVSWCEKGKKWRALMWDGSKQRFLGHYNTEMEAARAFDKAIVELKGRTARTNFPLSDYEGEIPSDPQGRQPAASSSQCKGVQLNRSSGLWDAKIRLHGRTLLLGSFNAEEAAARLFDASALSLRGPMAVTNFSPSSYSDADLLDAQARISTVMQEEEQRSTNKVLEKLRGKGSAQRHEPDWSQRNRSDQQALVPSTSKYLGVSIDPDTDKWQVSINKNGKIIYGGHYATAEEAAQAYDEYALKLLGPDTQLNFPHATKSAEGKGDMGGGGSRTVNSESRERWWPGPGKRSSQYKGVSWAEASMKWRAQCWTGSKVQYIGYYETEEEAARAYDIAILKLRGPNTQTNFDPASYDLKTIMAEAEQEQQQSQQQAQVEELPPSTSHGSRRVSNNDDGSNAQARREAIQAYAAAIAAAAAAAAQQSEEEKREAGLIARISDSQHTTGSKNSSLYRGVRWHERNTKWEARIFDGFRQKSLGYFEHEEEAARAYDREAIRIKGTCAPTNFPHADYQDELSRSLENPPQKRVKRTSESGQGHSQGQAQGSLSSPQGEQQWSQQRPRQGQSNAARGKGSRGPASS